MAGSIKLNIDKKTFDHVQKQIELAGEGGKASAYRALIKVLFRIQADARLRLTGRGHIITNRLRSSIFVKTQTPTITKDNQLTYSDNTGKSYSSDLSTVSVKEFEGAVGTNVEYAPAIELGANPHVIEAKNAKVLSDGKRIFGRRVNHPGFKGDSFLYWALKNVNILSSVKNDMTNDMRYGKFLKKQPITEVKGKALTNSDL